MYTLYIANKNYSSWSLRPWVLLSELDIPFEEKLFHFKQPSNWDEFRTFAPNGKVPCLVDGETTVWDSLAIAEYAAEAHPEVWAADKTARAWGRSVAAEMHSGFGALRTMCGMNVGVKIQLNEVTEALQKDINRVDEIWTEGLRKFGGPFLTGKAFTAADAFYAPVAYRVRTYGLQLGGEAMAYCNHMLSLKSMQAWEKAALAEVWRDGHEDEVRRYGKITEDNRT